MMHGWASRIHKTTLPTISKHKKRIQGEGKHPNPHTCKHNELGGKTCLKCAYPNPPRFLGHRYVFGSSYAHIYTVYMRPGNFFLRLSTEWSSPNCYLECMKISTVFLLLYFLSYPISKGAQGRIPGSSPLAPFPLSIHHHPVTQIRLKWLAQSNPVSLMASVDLNLNFPGPSNRLITTPHRKIKADRCRTRKWKINF